MAKTEFEQFILDEIERQKGLYLPIKAGAMERLMTKKAPCASLHPNPEDEFCFPDIGPSHKIISQYVNDFRARMSHDLEPLEDPVIVEKTHPDGYMLLNGHHRWAAALKLGIKSIPIKIVNLAQESDIKTMLENAKHDKRVTMDLDEVIFRDKKDPEAEALPGGHGKKKPKQRIRKGVPALFRFLTKSGYDIWVYSADYYSIDDIQDFFNSYSVHVDGIITGTQKAKKSATKAAKDMEKLISNHYKKTLHIDNDMVIATTEKSGEFQEYEINPAASEWSKEIMAVIGAMEKDES